MANMKEYRFVKKDPVIDLIRYGFDETKMTIKEVAFLAFVSEGTINNWLYGKTRRPQNITADCVLMILGITRTATWTATGKLVRANLKVIKGGKNA